MATAKTRIEQLLKVQCRIYNQVYNPAQTRTGNNILRQRLKGPALASYYSPKTVTLRNLKDVFPELETFDEDEVDRDEDIAFRKARGKGAPKKKRTPEESKKFAKKKTNVTSNSIP